MEEAFICRRDHGRAGLYKIVAQIIPLMLIVQNISLRKVEKMDDRGTKALQTLLLPEKTDIEFEAVLAAWAAKGGQVKRLGKYITIDYGPSTIIFLPTVQYS